MDRTQLRYFISAAQSQNFSEAARRHFITQPALSHHISALENELGIQLFARTGRQVRLTSAGELFLPEAMELLDRMDASVLIVQRHKEGKEGKITIGMVNTSNSALIKCLVCFKKLYPDIQVDVTMTTGIDQSTSINNGQYDFNFTIMPMVLGPSGLDYVVTHMDRFCLCVPAGHPLAKRPLDFALLKNEPFITIATSCAPLLHSQIYSICAKRNYEPKVTSRYNRMEATLLSVTAGTGISIMPKMIADEFSDSRVVKMPIPGDDCLITSVAAWRRNNLNSAALKFRDMLLEMFPTEGAKHDGD